MADVLLTGDITEEVLLESLESVLLAAGATVTGRTGFGSAGGTLTGASLTIKGSVTATGVGVNLFGGGAKDTEIVVADAGRIDASDGYAAMLLGVVDNVTVTNRGTISGGDVGIEYGAVYLDMTIQNSGTIEVLDGSAAIYGGVDFVEENLGRSNIFNTGTIVGGGVGDVITYPVFFAAIEVQGQLELVNDGTITALSSGAPGADAIAIATDGVTILRSDTDDAVTNGGLIEGAIHLGDGDDVVRNTGTIEGDIVLDRGADKVVNTGLIDGDILLGSGVDNYSAGEGGSVTGIVDGGGGNDRLAGADSEDVLNGGSGDDNLQGGGGSDVLDGGEGRDRIDGGSGADFIVGGAERDYLTGGDGEDVFYYFAATESALGADYDIIIDFETGDQIALRPMSADLIFVGAGPHIGEGMGSVALRDVEDGSLVTVDVDGDGVIDMSIGVQGDHELVRDDFFL